MFCFLGIQDLHVYHNRQTHLIPIYVLYLAGVLLIMVRFVFIIAESMFLEKVNEFEI